jgi:outer membrane autotransporter protein
MMMIVSGKRSKFAQGIILSLVLGVGFGGASVASAQAIDVTSGSDAHYDAGIYVPPGTATTRTESAQITIEPAASASGIIASGTRTSLTTAFADDSIVTPGSDSKQVDGIFATNGGSVSMNGGTIKIGAWNAVNGVEALGVTTDGTSVTLKNLGANFTVTGGDGATTKGLVATGFGEPTTVVVSGTDLDKITSVDGEVIGMQSFGKGNITFTADAHNVSKDIVVKSTGSGQATAILADFGGQNTVTGIRNIDAESASGEAFGLNADGGGKETANNVTMSGTLTVISSGNEATGIRSYDKGTNTITGATAINVKTLGQSTARGIYAEQGTVKVAPASGSSAVTLNVAGGSGADGITATHNSSVDFQGDVIVAAQQGGAYGVELGTGTNNVTGIKNIKVTNADGFEAAGIYGTDTSKTGGADGTNTITVAGNIDAEVSNADGYAEGVYNSYNQSLTVTVKGNVTTTSKNGSADVVYSDYDGGGTADVTVNGTMSVTGKDAFLAYADSGNTVTLTGGGAATVQGTHYAAVAELDEQSTINLKNIVANVVGPQNNTYALHGFSDGTFNLINTTITGNGAHGGADVYFANSGSDPDNILNVNIDATSKLTGAVRVEAIGPDMGGISLTNAGLWNVTGDSNLNANGTSTITNTGTIDMSKDGTTAASQTFSTIEVNSLNNSGNIIMDVSTTDASASDKIIASTASGNGTLTANIPAALLNTSYKAYLESEDAPLIKVTGSNTSNYTIGNNGNNKLELGNWTYKLVTYTMPDGSIGYRLANSNTMSNKGKTILGSLVSPDYWYYETNALYADLPNFTSARTDKDVWAHAVHNKLTISIIAISASASDIDTNYSGVVAGIDKKLSDNAKGTLWAGVMVGYGKGDSDFDGGNAYTDSGHVSLYTVYKSKSDWYMAGILKYNRYGTEIETATSAGTTGGVHSSGKLNQNGYGLSIMGGKRFKASKGWFVEPQVEFGYHRIGSGEYNLGDEEVDVDAVTSKRLRAGINFGKNLTYKNGASLDVFAQASLVHEFGGDYTINTSNRYGSGTDSLDVDYGGSWGLYKLGVDYSEPRGNSFGLALTYNKGGHRSSPLGVELTYNWAF